MTTGRMCWRPEEEAFCTKRGGIKLTGSEMKFNFGGDFEWELELEEHYELAVL